MKTDPSSTMTHARLVRLRRALGISQQELAWTLGASAASIHRWETGESRGPHGLELTVLRELETRVRDDPKFGETLSRSMDLGQRHMLIVLFHPKPTRTKP